MNKTRTLVSPTRRQLTTWLLSITKPVLTPLAFSALCRCLDQVAGIALFALPAWQIALMVQNRYLPGLSGPAPWPWWQTVLIMVVISLTKALLRYGEQFLGHLVAFKALELLRAEVFRRLYPQAPAIMTQAHSGELLTRLTRDIDRIEVFFAHTFAPAVSAVVVPGALVIWGFCALPLPVALTLLAVLLAAIVLVPALGFGFGLRTSRAVLGQRGRLSAHLTDSIGGLQEVSGYGLESVREREMATLQRPLAASATATGAVVGLRGGLELFLRAGAFTALLCVGLPFVQTGQLSLAALLVGAVATLRLWEIVGGVASFGADLNHAFAAATRVYQVRFAGFELPEADLKNASNTPNVSEEASYISHGSNKTVNDVIDYPARFGQAPGVEFLDVTYAYPARGGAANLLQGGAARPVATVGRQGVTEKPAVSGVNLKLPAGKWSAIVGVSGSGKSTLARLALRYFDPQSGRVMLGGKDVKEMPVRQLRQLVSLVTPDIRLFNNTIAYNLRLAAPQASEAQLWQALERACLAEEVRGFERALETRVGEKGAALSGGQRQRLSLAQALLRDSQVLILDEFTSHLNPELARQVRDSLREQLGQITVLEITHLLDQIEQADLVAVLEKGQVLETGTPAELFAQPDSVLSWLKGRNI